MNRRELKSYGITYLQITLLVCAVFVFNRASSKGLRWIHVNQPGYSPSPIKVGTGSLVGKDAFFKGFSIKLSNFNEIW